MRTTVFKVFGDPSDLELPGRTVAVRTGGTAMTGYLVSLLMGLVVGASCGLVQVRSPAPPTIALLGVFGMLLGQTAVDIAKRHLAPLTHSSIQQNEDGVQGRSQSG
jgi:XapX domain-containing protein